MLMKPKTFLMIAAFGYGVLFALALTGLVRLSYAACGVALPASLPGNVFLATSLIAGTISAIIHARRTKLAESHATAAREFAHGE